MLTVQEFYDTLKCKFNSVKNEEQTKQALVLPFLSYLGWDIFDPEEVQPEYCAGYYKDKEKIDYVLFRNGEPVVLIECKPLGTDLDKYKAQLAKYFNTTLTADLGILTDGNAYWFFSDTLHKNIMDDVPFYKLVVSDNDTSIDYLKKETYNFRHLYTSMMSKSVVQTIISDLMSVQVNDKFLQIVLRGYTKKITPEIVTNLRSALLDILSGENTIQSDGVCENNSNVEMGCESVVGLDNNQVKSRDYSKYKYKGKVWNKRQLAYAIIRDFALENHWDFETLNRTFTKEFNRFADPVCEQHEVDSSRLVRYFSKPEEIIYTSDNRMAMITNQWGLEDILKLIEFARSRGFNIEPVN